MKILNKKIMIFFALLVVLVPSANAVASLNDLLNSYYTKSSAWQSTLAPIALQMYWFWFTCELLYQITIKKVLANDINKLWYFVMVRTFVGYMFAAIFVGNADHGVLKPGTNFYFDIIKYFVSLGSQAGGYTITPMSGSPFGAMSPTALLDFGSEVWNNNIQLVSHLSGYSAPVVLGLPIVLISCCMYALIAIMALTLFMTALEGYIVMNAGIILCGFAGSSWTMGFWNKYLSYVGGIAIRLFVMCLILGLVFDQIQIDIMNLTLAGTDVIKSSSSDASVSAYLAYLLKVVIDTLICTFLVVKIPALAGSMLTGAVNSGLGDVITGASMVLAGAGLAAGLAKMGVNLGGNSGAVGGGAKEAFKDSLRGNGGGGLPSGGGSSSSEAMRTASQTAQSATSSAEKAQGIADLSKDLKGTSATSSQSSPSSNASSSNSPKMNSATSSSTSSNNTTSNKSSTGPQNNSSGDDKSNGGISGNEKIPTGANNNNINPVDSTTNKAMKSKASQDMIKNKDALIKNFEKMVSNNHSGAAEISINPHRE